MAGPPRSCPTRRAGRSLRQRLRNPVNPAKHNFAPVDNAPAVHRAFRRSSAARILAVVWQQLAAAQAGILTRAQALRAGLTRAAIHARLVTGRWQRVHYGILATFSGPLPRPAQLWAAVLSAGPGAVLSHETAAELHGLAERPSPTVHVSVPTARRVVTPPGVVIHRSARAERGRHPALEPPRTRIEETVIDLVHASRDADHAIAWLARAVGARLTTPTRLRAAAQDRYRLRWLRDVLTALDDVAAGCHSVLELHYLRLVERSHGLPPGSRQQRRNAWYDDVHYTGFGLCVELDGRLAHPVDQRFRDHRRDNAATVAGARVLRYGHADVTRRPCAVATEVATVLNANGWPGAPRRCGAGCML